MNKYDYKPYILIGSIGLVFFVNMSLAYDVHFLVTLLIVAASSSFIQRGYKFIEKNYKREKAKSIKRSLIYLFLLNILITSALALFNPIISILVGTLLTIMTILFTNYFF